MAEKIAGDEDVGDIPRDVGAHAGAFEERVGEGDEGVAGNAWFGHVQGSVRRRRDRGATVDAVSIFRHSTWRTTRSSLPVAIHAAMNPASSCFPRR